MVDRIKVYTIEEVVNILKISRRTIYNYIKAKQLKAVKIGRAWRVSEKALNDFLENGTEDGYFQTIASPSQTIKARKAKREAARRLKDSIK